MPAWLPKIPWRLLRWLAYVAVFVILVHLLLPAPVGLAHGRREYLFEGIVCDARTERPLGGVSLTLKLRRPGWGSSEPPEVTSEPLSTSVDGNTPFGATGADGTFKFYYGYLFSYSAVRRPHRPEEESPPRPTEFIISAAHQGYSPVEHGLAPPAARSEEHLFEMKGIVIELKPEPAVERTPPEGAPRPRPN